MNLHPLMATIPSPHCITASLLYFKPSTTRSRVLLLVHPSNRRRSLARMASLDAGEVAGNSEISNDVLVQYVVLRRDLIDTWPLGSVVTQGCHAAVAAIWSHKDDAHTLEYCSATNIDSMHKVSSLFLPFFFF